MKQNSARTTPTTLAAKYQLALLLVEEKRWEQAERLCAELLESARAKTPGPSLWVAGFQGQLGMIQLALNKPMEAESTLRSCLEAREKLQPAGWTTLNTRGLLGIAHLRQQKYADAEKLLVHACEGMLQLGDRLPLAGKARLMESIARLEELYMLTDRPEEARRWHAKQPVEQTPEPREVSQ